MLIEQIVELQLREPGPPWPNMHFYNWLFSRQKNISKENLRVGFHLLLKYCTDNAPYFRLPGPNHVQLNFNTKMQDVKRVLDLKCT